MEVDYFQAGEHYVRFDAEVPCVIIENNIYTTSEDFRSALTKTLECFVEHVKNHPKLGWLADTSNAEVFRDEDIAWVNNELNPQMIAGGVRYIAFAVPKDVFATMGIEEYTENTDPDAINIKYFTTKAEAKEWLKAVNLSN
ncbi:MAG: STAS/SEC14 domain-containing protein [Microscillaceae bacterium]|jgi:hypothetical protein|nr:STAS/SEC14 domain-containing protein [Microscillaceae bacterium]